VTHPNGGIHPRRLPIRRRAPAAADGTHGPPRPRGRGARRYRRDRDRRRGCVRVDRLRPAL